MTPAQLAKRIKKGERWKIADESLRTYVVAECIACNQQMDILANDFGPDDYP